jgi:deoxycytidine triphosphate deaminase
MQHKPKPGVLSDDQITEWASSGGVKPFDHRLVNPASIDLRWSGKSRCAYHWGWSEVEDSNELLVIPGLLYLLDTVEIVSLPDNMAGILSLKSSMGRTGLEHLHAGWFDPGFTGTATLEIKNMAPWTITLKRGQPIVQLALIFMSQKPRLSYKDTGRYNGQEGPTIAR